MAFLTWTIIMLVVLVGPCTVDGGQGPHEAAPVANQLTGEGGDSPCQLLGVVLARVSTLKKLKATNGTFFDKECKTMRDHVVKMKATVDECTAKNRTLLEQLERLSAYCGDVVAEAAAAMEKELPQLHRFRRADDATTQGAPSLREKQLGAAATLMVAAMTMLKATR